MCNSVIPVALVMITLLQLFHGTVYPVSCVCNAGIASFITKQLLYTKLNIKPLNYETVYIKCTDKLDLKYKYYC